MDFDWGAWFSANTSGIIGVTATLLGSISGALLAGRATLSASREQVRAAHNQYWFPKQFDYLTETSEAASEQYIVLTAAASDLARFIEDARAARRTGKAVDPNYRVDDALRVRIQLATEQWRRLLAKRLMFAFPEVSESMVNFDAQREAVVLALNKPDDAAVIRACLDRLSGPAFGELMLALTLARNYHTSILNTSLQTKRRAARDRKDAQAVQDKAWDEWATLLRARGADADRFKD